MAKTTKELLEGFSFAGTFLFSQKADAEGVAAMLGLRGAFPMQTDEGLFWMPGASYDELMDRIYSEWTLPDQATVPQAHPQEPQKTLPFLAYLDKSGER
jgi:hypothetical protein